MKAAKIFPLISILLFGIFFLSSSNFSVSAKEENDGPIDNQYQATSTYAPLQQRFSNLLDQSILYLNPKLISTDFGPKGTDCSSPTVFDDQWSQGYRLVCQNNLYVLMVDLTNPAVKVEVAATSSGLASVSSFADGNTIAIINADYNYYSANPSECNSNICSQGLTKVNGSDPTTYTNIQHLCSDARVRRVIGLTEDARVVVDWWYKYVSDGQARAWCGDIPGSGGGLESYSYNVVGGGPQFTFDGTFHWDCQYGVGSDGNCLASGQDVGINGEHFGPGNWWDRPQSAIGYTTDGQVLVLAESNNTSHTMQEVHDIMYMRLQDYGKTLKNAFKFDGGSKAGFWYYNSAYWSTPGVTVPNVIRIQKTNSTCYTLSTGVNPGGAGNVDVQTAPNCAQGKYKPGTNVTLQANPNQGYSFDYWSGDASGNSNPTVLTIDGNKNVTANFTGGASCDPSSNQVTLYANINYGSPCVILNTGDYPNPSYLGSVGNDNVESIRVGTEVRAILYEHDNYNGLSETFTGDDANLWDNTIGGNSVSSVKVQVDAIPPSANFDASPTNGFAPLDVTFHIVNTGGITGCNWDYGDSQTGTSCDAYHSHTYNNPGNYTVSLSVSGPGGSDSLTRSNYIVVMESASPPGAFGKSLPANGATNISTNPTLSWEPSNGASYYEYCCDTTNDNACSIWINAGINNNVNLSGLTPDTFYYWHVRALNQSGITYANGSETAWWSFRTYSTSTQFSIYLPLTVSNFQALPPPANQSPYIPSNPFPAAGAINLPINTGLSWSGGDPDGDQVTYDVYLEAGDNTPGVLVCDNAASTRCNPGLFSYGTLYSWRVVARDEHAASAAGSVWTFTTSEAPISWYESFDTYTSGSLLNGQGGWKGWVNDPSATAYVTNSLSRSTPNSVEIANASDLVHEYANITSGIWTYKTWQYIPSSLNGQTYFILMNQYDDAGTTLNWSTEVMFDGATDLLVNDGITGGSLPIQYDQWVEIQVTIDLNANTQQFYYGGSLLFQGSWTEEVSGGGIRNLAAVDLFANSATAVYYDDMSLGLQGKE